MARKQSTAAAALSPATEASQPDASSRRSRRTQVPLPANVSQQDSKPQLRKPSRGGGAAPTNPNTNPDILDGISALRASPDSAEHEDTDRPLKPRVNNVSTGGNPSATTEATAVHRDEHGRKGRGNAITPAGGAGNQAHVTNTNQLASKAPTADLHPEPGRSKRKRTAPQHVKVDSAEINNATVLAADQHVTPPTSNGVKVEDDVGVTVDPEEEEGPKDENEDEEEVTEALSRPPPVNSDYLPLPWKGRLGYACLNTYLRNANPPVFSSRTCRIASILEHRHPLKDPSQPEHATKNRPDKDQPADLARGQRYVEELGLANARDIIKMVRWNDKYGIKFMRLSSEMFPFASHDVYGYKLAPFASETLAEAGQMIAKLGHRVTTHPGQFTQLGSPRKEVIDAAIRDLDYHEELLSLLRLPPQEDRDAVMILHLGGAFGDKPATLDRFRANYARLSPAVKKRLVLENDDVVWCAHELLPMCQELNIPFVLDFHHHNILFDSTQIREGTKDIIDLYPAILETWTKKGITPKMHYSEPRPEAITKKSRRKHSPRVMTLPPCPDTMDLMIEAKDKEQAVFELMRTFKLPGFSTFNDIIPHVRQDENKPWKPKPKKAAKKGKKKKKDDLEMLDEQVEEAEEEEKPPPIVPDEEVGMGGPEGRVYWPPGMEEWLRPPKRIVKKKEEGAATPAKKKRKTAAADEASLDGEVNGTDEAKTPAKKPAPKKAASSAKRKVPAKAVPTPAPSDEDEDSPLSDLGGDDSDIAVPSKPTPRPASARKRSGRVAKVNYAEDAADMSV